MHMKEFQFKRGVEHASKTLSAQIRRSSTLSKPDGIWESLGPR